MAATDKRPLDGILLLDKPGGMSSNSALQKAKRLLRARKAGHTGSLDPLATGLLPLCFGEATKVSGFLLDADKRYVTTVRLGVTTTTADREGDVLETRPAEHIGRAEVEAVLLRFLGDILQVPPMYSALKHQGERLYKLARKGVEVEREARPVTIFEIKLQALRPAELDLEVHCSKGTYIRSLAQDIGEALGVGGHVAALRRTALGPFQDEPMVTLEELAARVAADAQAVEASLLPMDAALGRWPQIRLTADGAHYIRHGQPVWVPKAPADGLVRLYGAQDEFLGMGVVLDDGRVAPKRMLAV